MMELVVPRLIVRPRFVSTPDTVRLVFTVTRPVPPEIESAGVIPLGAEPGEPGRLDPKLRSPPAALPVPWPPEIVKPIPAELGPLPPVGRSMTGPQAAALAEY